MGWVKKVVVGRKGCGDKEHKVKIVVFKESFTQETVPQSRSFLENLSEWNSLLTFKIGRK